MDFSLLTSNKTKCRSALFSTLAILVLETFLTGVNLICVINEKELLSALSEKDVRN